MSKLFTNATIILADRLLPDGLLLDDPDVEIICDGCHLPPELIKLAVKCKGYDKLMLVSDSGPWPAIPRANIWPISAP